MEINRAIDTGGVCLDVFQRFGLKPTCVTVMLSDCLFWPSTDSTNLPTLGTLTCGILPIKMAFPIIAAGVHGPTVEIPDNIILESFFDLLCAHDSSITNDGIVKTRQCSLFTTDLRTQLINLLSRLGCVDVPTRTNIKQLVVEVARHLRTKRCLGQLYTMASGVPIPLVEFWKQLTIEQLFGVYKAMNATPSKVLAIIEEPDDPDDMNMAQAKALSFLKTFVANSNPDDLRVLLRFITGSSVMIDFPIKVVFNNLTGFGRRVIAHTCDCTVEFPSSYETYPEFQLELVKLLSSDFSWTMDAL